MFRTDGLPVQEGRNRRSEVRPAAALPISQTRCSTCRGRFADRSSERLARVRKALTRSTRSPWERSSGGHARIERAGLVRHARAEQPKTSRDANPTARSERLNDRKSAKRADAGCLGALIRPGRPPRWYDERRARDSTKVTPRRALSEASLDRELTRLHDQVRVRASPGEAGGGTSLRTHVPRSGCWTWRPGLHERAPSGTRHGRQLFREWVRRVGSISAGRLRTELVGRRPGSSSVPTPACRLAGGWPASPVGGSGPYRGWKTACFGTPGSGRGCYRGASH